MKKLVCMLTALMMMATVIGFPVADVAYAETNVNNNVKGVLSESSDLDTEGESGGEIEDPGDEPGEDPGEEPVEPTLIDIADAIVTLSQSSYNYTGKAIEPKVKVQYNEVALENGTDYTVTFSNNVKAGTATVTVNGEGKYTGTKKTTFKIKAISLSKAKVTIKYSNYAYTGKTITPVPTVKLNGTTLKKNVDYTVSYSKNKYPGTATIKINGKGNYSGSVNKKFYIGKMGSLSLKSRGSSKLKLGWSKKDKVTGYQIYRYDSSKGKYVWCKTIKGAKNTRTTIEGLKSAYRYSFKIRAYVKDSNGDVHYGEFGPRIKTFTKPAKVSISKLSTNIKMELKLKWKKTRCDGYQIQVDDNSKFSSPAKYTVKSSKTVNKTIKASKDDKIYYVKVRAYKTINGKKTYGAWSSVKKIKTEGDGWGTIDGRKYYCKNGVPVKGNKVIDGNHYFFGRNSGALMGVNHKMYRKVKDEKSGTKYLIAVSRTKNRVCIYHKSEGEWVVKYYWKCSTGAPGLISPISKTPAGYYNVPKKTTHKLHFGEENGYTCWYATRIKKGYYFHSVLYNPYSKTSIQDGRLGYNVSHGCVRLALENAKWMYDNIDAGTRIVIMN